MEMETSLNSVSGHDVNFADIVVTMILVMLLLVLVLLVLVSARFLLQNRTHLQTPTIRIMVSEKAIQTDAGHEYSITFGRIWISPAGETYHADHNYHGLRAAKSTSHWYPCQYCAGYTRKNR